MPSAGSRYWTLRPLSVWMRPKLPELLKRWGPTVQLWSEMPRLHVKHLSGGRGHLCGACLHPTTITWGTHAGNVEGGHWREREGLPVFSNFLWSSTMGLCTWSTWGTHVPSTVIDGEHVFGCSLGHFPSVIHCHGWTCPWNSHSTMLAAPVSKWQCHSSGKEATRPATPTKEPTHQKQKEGKFLVGLKENCQEVFCRDFNLVWAMRQRYFEAHHPTFNQEGSHDLSDLFQEMITSANLLDSEIYEIQEIWTGLKDFQYANDALKSSLKGLQFFHPMSPSELLKVMGLKGIHHPKALHHHMGLSYCPWCGKEGQNKGTIVNHLQTMDYNLGLICSRCLHCPAITSEAIWHHGPSCKHLGMKEEDERSGNKDSSSSD